MRKLHRSRELQLTSVIGTRPLMGSIHASRIARTSRTGGRSIPPLHSVCLSLENRVIGEIGEICRHVRVHTVPGYRYYWGEAAVTQAASVFHLIRFDLLNCINRARPGCFSPLLSFRAFISSRARTGGVRNSDCFKINTSSTQHHYLTETWPHSVNHQFYNSSCLRAFPLYFIYIFATRLSVSSNGKEAWPGAIVGAHRFFFSQLRVSQQSKRFCEVDGDRARIYDYANRWTNRDRLPLWSSFPRAERSCFPSFSASKLEASIAGRAPVG